MKKDANSAFKLLVNYFLETGEFDELAGELYRIALKLGNDAQLYLTAKGMNTGNQEFDQDDSRKIFQPYEIPETEYKLFIPLISSDGRVDKKKLQKFKREMEGYVWLNLLEAREAFDLEPVEAIYFLKKFPEKIKDIGEVMGSDRKILVKRKGVDERGLLKLSFGRISQEYKKVKEFLKEKNLSSNPFFNVWLTEELIRWGEKENSYKLPQLKKRLDGYRFAAPEELNHFFEKYRIDRNQFYDKLFHGEAGKLVFYLFPNKRIYLFRMNENGEIDWDAIAEKLSL